MEIATIEIVIRHQQAVQANKEVQSELDKTEKKATKATESIGGSFERLKKNIFSVRGALTTLTAGVGFAGLVRVISDFEVALSQVRGALQATDKEMARISARAREIGVTTTYGAAQAAQAMTAMGKAGFTVAESMDKVVDLLKFAATGTIGLGEAASTTRRIITNFGLDMSQVGDVMDVLTTTALKADAEVREIASALRVVAPAAKATKQDLRDISAVLGVMSNAGAEAGAAGVALRAVLNTLAKPSDRVKDTLEQLGIKMREVNPATKSVVEIFQRLAEAGLSLEQANELVGFRMGSTVLAVTQAVPAMAELRAELDKASGSTKKLADTLDDNLAGSMRRLKGAFNEIILQTGDAGLSGALRNVTEFLTNTLLAMAGLLPEATKGAAAFEALAVAIKLAAAAFAGFAIGKLVGGLVAFIGNVYKAVVAIRAMTAAQLSLNIAMLANPIAATMALIGLLAGAYFVFRDSARDAASAQADFNKVMAQGDKALDEYRKTTAEATAEQQKTTKIGLEAALVTYQAELKKTEKDLVSLREEMGVGFIPFQQSADPAINALKRLSDEFKNGKVGVDEYLVKLQGFAVGSGSAAVRARKMTEAVGENRERFLEASESVITYNNRIDEHKQALAGTLSKVDALAAATSNLGEVFKLTAEGASVLSAEMRALGNLEEGTVAALNAAGKSLKDFEALAGSVGKSEAQQAREQIIERKNDIIAELQEAGASLESIARAEAAAAKILRGIKDDADNAKDQEKERLVDAFRSLQEAYDPLTTAALAYKNVQEQIAKAEAANVGTDEQRAKILAGAAETYRMATEPLAELHKEMDREVELMKMTDAQRQISIQLYGIEMEMRNKGTQLTQEEIKGLKDRLELMQQEARDMADTKQILEQLKTPVENYNERLTRLNELLDRGKLTWDEYGRAAKRAADDVKRASGQMATFAEEAARQSEQAFADFLFDPFEDGLEGMVESFGKAMLRIAANQVAAQLLGSLGNFGATQAGAGGVMGVVGKAATFLGGGGTDTSGMMQPRTTPPGVQPTVPGAGAASTAAQLATVVATSSEKMGQAATAAGETMSKAIEGSGVAAGQTLQEGGAGLASGLSGALQQGGAGLGEGLRTAFSWGRDLFSGLFSGLGSMMSGMGQGLGGMFSSMFGGGAAAATGGAGAAIGLADGGGPAQKNKIYKIGSGAQPELFIPREAGTFFTRQQMDSKSPTDTIKRLMMGSTSKMKKSDFKSPTDPTRRMLSMMGANEDKFGRGMKRGDLGRQPVVEFLRSQKSATERMERATNTKRHLTLVASRDSGGSATEGSTNRVGAGAQPEYFFSKGAATTPARSDAATPGSGKTEWKVVQNFVFPEARANVSQATQAQVGVKAASGLREFQRRNG